MSIPSILTSEFYKTLEHAVVEEDLKIGHAVSFKRLSGGHVLLQTWFYDQGLASGPRWIRTAHIEIKRDGARVLRNLLRPSGPSTKPSRSE